MDDVDLPNFEGGWVALLNMQQEMGGTGLPVCFLEMPLLVVSPPDVDFVALFQLYSARYFRTKHWQASGTRRPVVLHTHARPIHQAPLRFDSSQEQTFAHCMAEQRSAKCQGGICPQQSCLCIDFAES